VSLELVSPLSRIRTLGAFVKCALLPVMLFVLADVPTAFSQTTPFSVNDIEKLAKEGIGEQAFLESVKQHGIDFPPTLDAIEELKADQVPGSVLKEIGRHIPQDRAPDFYLKEGGRYEEKGYFAEAVAFYQTMLVLMPDDPVAKHRIEEAKEKQRGAEQNGQRQDAQQNERPRLPYYHQQLLISLQKSNCKDAFYYTRKIFLVEPDQSAKEAFEKTCEPYSLTLKDGTQVILEFQNDLYGSKAHAGDKIDFRVVDPIVVNGLLVVRQNGPAWGTITKSKGGRRFMRGGQLGVSVDGMGLADDEKCQLVAVETYRGSHKSGVDKTAIAATDVLTVGAAIPVEAFIHGKDAKIAAGTKITAKIKGDMNLVPTQFAPPESPPPPPPPVGSISFQNQSGTDAVIRLLGPSVQKLILLDGQSVDAHVDPGAYDVLVRYGRAPSEYLYSKAGPISVTKHSNFHIALHKLSVNNPNAQKEFDKSQ
jgi:hypothetical protein